MSSILTTISHLQPHTQTICKATALRATSFLATRFSSSLAHDDYVKPVNVSHWEKLAEKELSKSNKTVDSLRTERITPVRFCLVLWLEISMISFPILCRCSFYNMIVLGRNCHSACVLQSWWRKSCHAGKLRTVVIESYILHIHSQYISFV